ncbi:MAG: hypothetical protein H6585_15500 [Flavobacteriales bacterium]|nr:hypothetical protein [Flavobacteriales bacterium]MCB9449736.1 hypothetical protein [Flavobacteriales bacterium]
MTKPDRHKQIETMSALALAGCVLYYWKGHTWMLYAAIASLVIGLFIKFIAVYITMGWLKITELLGRINGFVLLSVIFFFVLTPLAFLKRLGSKRSFLKQPSGASNYKEKDHTYSADDIAMPW